MFIYYYAINELNRTESDIYIYIQPTCVTHWQPPFAVKVIHTLYNACI